VDLIRRRRNREESIDLNRPGGEAQLRTRSGPDRLTEDRELRARVAGAIRELSDARRPVVRMYLAGYQSEEIATRLGWTEPKTRNLLYRGLTELRERLTQLGIGPEGES
jgi:RNA polymerase sigma-70 factor (ECF subfamily)